MTVDFMIIGAQKCGTTSMAAQLAQHSKICFCREKEPHFFSTTRNWKGELDRYHSLYDPAPGQLCGEASTSYTFLPEYPDVHERLHQYNRDLRLIYVMRNPVERIVSHFAHDFVRGDAGPRPEEAVLRDPMYLGRTRYATQLRPYLDLFPSNQMKLIVFEEYVKAPLDTLRELARFLDIDAAGFDDVDLSPRNRSAGTRFMKQFPGSGTAQKLMDYAPGPIRAAGVKLLMNEIAEKPEFSPELRATLWTTLGNEVRATEELLGRPIDVWKQ